MAEDPKYLASWPPNGARVVELDGCVGRTPSGGYIYKMKGGGFLRWPDDAATRLSDMFPSAPPAQGPSPDRPTRILHVRPVPPEEYFPELRGKKP
jgi:hypothetical protein